MTRLESSVGRAATTIGALQTLLEHYQRVAGAISPGVAAASYDRPLVSASGVSDRTGNAATAGGTETDPPADSVHRHQWTVNGHLLDALKHLDQAHRLMVELVTPGTKDTTNRADRTTAPCQACERPVACTATDPLRGGHCNACRMLKHRWSAELPTMGDNAVFRREVRRQIQAGELHRPDSPHTPKNRRIHERET